MILLSQSSFAQITKHVKLGGALRFNYRYKNWDESSIKEGGDFVFDLFRLNAKANYKQLYLDAEYRFYPNAFGGGMLHHGFIGYRFSDEQELQIGVSQVPFGLLPITSHSFFFNLPYYVGLEDDYDAGIKYLHRQGDWDFALGLYKNAEGANQTIDLENGKSFSGVDPARFSYDLGGAYKEIAQINLRAARHFGKHEIGVSYQYGLALDYSINLEDLSLKDAAKEQFNSTAVALHYEGKFLDDDRLNVKLQGLYYKHANRKNTLTMVAFNGGYEVASEATILCGGLAYTFPVNWGPIESIQLYDNYNYMIKSHKDFNDTQMNVLGMLLTAGPIYTYVDYASSCNQNWFGAKDGFAAGEKSAVWNSWFNINIGYYF